MTNRIYVGPRPVQMRGQPAPVQAHQTPPGQQNVPRFQETLNRALRQPVKLSGHAQERLVASRRQLTDAELASLAGAVDRAAAKGARDALILMRDLALVVSISNRTVITAVDGERMKESIFTNIDSAVILEP